MFFSVGILDDKRTNCILQSSNDNKLSFSNLSKGKHRLIVNYKTPNLVPSTYTPEFAIRNGITGETYDRISYIDSFIVEGHTVPRGIMHVESEWKLEKIEN